MISLYIHFTAEIYDKLSRSVYSIAFVLTCLKDDIM